MRIVGGLAKGRQLAVPGHGTRPTSDRAREAMFNTLPGLLDLTGIRVLDLFAGTGAVGLEALSRGAGEVTLVESNRIAAEVLARNIASVGLKGASLRRVTAEAFVASAPSGPAFRLVFADPPYAYRDDQLAALLHAVARHAESGGAIVVERSARSPAPSWPDSIEPIKQRRYGEILLWYGRRQ